MILKELFEGYKNTFEKGDNIETALGVGKVTKKVDEEHFMFQPDAASQKKYDLENRPYKMSYDEIHKHL